MHGSDQLGQDNTAGLRSIGLTEPGPDALMTLLRITSAGAQMAGEEIPNRQSARCFRQKERKSR